MRRARAGASSRAPGRTARRRRGPSCGRGSSTIVDLLQRPTERADGVDALQERARRLRVLARPSGRAARRDAGCRAAGDRRGPRPPRRCRRRGRSARGRACPRRSSAGRRQRLGERIDARRAQQRAGTDQRQADEGGRIVGVARARRERCRASRSWRCRRSRTASRRAGSARSRRRSGRAFVPRPAPAPTPRSRSRHRPRRRRCGRRRRGRAWPAAAPSRVRGRRACRGRRRRGRRPGRSRSTIASCIARGDRLRLGEGQPRARSPPALRRSRGARRPPARRPRTAGAGARAARAGSARSRRGRGGAAAQRRLSIAASSVRAGAYTGTMADSPSRECRSAPPRCRGLRRRRRRARRHLAGGRLPRLLAATLPPEGGAGRARRSPGTCSGRRRELAGRRRAAFARDRRRHRRDARMPALPAADAPGRCTPSDASSSSHGEDAAAALDAESEDDVLALAPALDLRADRGRAAPRAAARAPPRACPEPLPRALLDEEAPPTRPSTRSPRSPR